MKKVLLNFAVVMPSLIAAFLLGMRIGETRTQQGSNAVATNCGVALTDRDTSTFGMSSQIANFSGNDFLSAPTSNFRSDVNASLLSHSWGNWSQHKTEWDEIKKAVAAYEQSLDDEHRQSEKEREATFGFTEREATFGLTSMNFPIDLIDWPY
jgi:hypothetical protein